jgi:glutathione synthase/RimK-type ligase-like ATP-grasp enzyme
MVYFVSKIKTKSYRIDMKKIAIHFLDKGQDPFAHLWIEYCTSNKIPFKVVNCFDSNIVEQLGDCDALMFHFSLAHAPKMLFARQLLHSIETNGKKVFPNFHTMWHYDDKVGQKYLLEAIGAPLVPTYVFYNRKDAESWASTTSYPKVFKLRNGAGSSNVRLVRSKDQAMDLIKQAFGKGFSHQRDAWEYLQEKWRLYKLDKSKFGGVKYAFKRLFYVRKDERKYGLERGYVYFQDFVPDNEFDVRIVFVNNNIYGFRRKIRKNDFRASGSGEFDFKANSIPIDCVKIAQSVCERLALQCCAFDFVIGPNSEPLIVEISYTFASSGNFKKCEGYWDKNLNWHHGSFDPYGWMVESILKEFN